MLDFTRRRASPTCPLIILGTIWWPHSCQCAAPRATTPPSRSTAAHMPPQAAHPCQSDRQILLGVSRSEPSKCMICSPSKVMQLHSPPKDGSRVSAVAYSAHASELFKSFQAFLFCLSFLFGDTQSLGCNRKFAGNRVGEGVSHNCVLSLKK